jgi:hypothetical protein
LWCPGGSQVHKLLPKFHPVICQGHPSSDSITNQLRDISYPKTRREEIGRFRQVRIDSGCRVGYLET